MLTACT